MRRGSVALAKLSRYSPDLYYLKIRPFQLQIPLDGMRPLVTRSFRLNVLHDYEQGLTVRYTGRELIFAIGDTFEFGDAIAVGFCSDGCVARSGFVLMWRQDDCQVLKRFAGPIPYLNCETAGNMVFRIAIGTRRSGQRFCQKERRD